MTTDDIPANGGGATAQKPLKWGIMGCGMISNDFVHAVLRNGKQPHIVSAQLDWDLYWHWHIYSPNHIQIHAVATANSPERAQQFVQKLQVPEDAKAQIKAYGSYDEMLADPEIEVVYVGILNQTHCPWVCACLERGKNVLCEKPMGQSRAETEKIAAKAREKGLFVMEALWSRFFPVWRQLRAVLDKKQFGAVKQIQATFGTLLPSNRFDVSISECPAVDIGIYCVQFAMFCMDDQQPSVIKAHAVKNANGVDICGEFCLEFGGEGEKAQARASLLYNTEVPCPNSAFVAFEKGIFEIRESFYCPTRARIIKGKPFGQDMDVEELNFPLADNDQSIYNFPNSSGLHFEADHVFECLRSNLKESPVAGLEASLRIASILEEIRRQIGIKFPAQDDSADKCCQDSSAEKCCQ